MKTTRRDFLARSAVTAAGLAGLRATPARAAEADPALRRYDSVVQLYFDGGPAQTDTRDPKPGSPSNVVDTIDLGVSDPYGEPVRVADFLAPLVDLVARAPDAYGLGIVRSLTHGNGAHEIASTWMNAFWQSPVVQLYVSAR